MKPSDWKLPSNEWGKDIPSPEDMREALTLLDLTRRVIEEDYPLQADIIKKLLIKFQPTKKSKGMPDPVPMPKAPEKAEENFVYFSKSKGRKIVLTKKGAEMVNTNPDQYEYVCSAPHADGDMSYGCGRDYCRCSQ